MAQEPRSTGRGGAGNINNKPGAGVSADDLATPTIKSERYTTGRGGSGNMAKNDPTNPGESRAAQDVDTPAHHARDMHGTYHWGRGGEGNMTTIGKSGAEQSREQSKERPAARLAARTMSGESGKERRSGSFTSAINRGKEMLGLKKGAAELKDESAIE